MIQLTAQQITLDASADGEPTRQITGLAVPWNVKATLSGGESVVFLEGSLPEDGPMPKLLECWFSFPSKAAASCSLI